MRVCDGSCRRLATIERRLPEAATTALVRELREHAASVSQARSGDTADLLLRAAETLERLHRATPGGG